MNSFDKNLKRLRNQRNLKQEELAERLNVTRQTISGWETGRRQPDLDMLKKLAEALNVDMHELIYGNKPEAYPRFQRRHVIRTALFGGIAAILMLFRLLALPYLIPIINRNRWGSLLTAFYVLLPQIGSFVLGAFFPCLIRLFSAVHMKKQHNFWCLTAGLTLLLPVLLFWLGIPAFNKLVLYPQGNALLLYILPAISGFFLTTGILCGIEDEANTQKDGK